MASFKDLAGREWKVVIDTWQLRVVREATGFEIGKLFDDKMRRYTDLAADPCLFGSVMFALCASEVKERATSEEEFHRGLAGDPLEAAHEAFHKAVMDFSPSRRRLLLEAMATKQEEVETLAMTEATEQIAAIDPKAVLAEMTATLKSSAGGSVESAESTLAPPG